MNAMRKTEYPINKIFTDRWSPRAMSGETLTDRELLSLFEAAKWAPSSYNNQPWRFLYAKRGTSQWDAFFGVLGEFNQSW
ncbi:MAG TPA: nitroreductase family protein, partial [Candidatus Nanoarchaeia archaeon]|nr:nitroreductase family protein [Candidatus Nanoarchaeia archaeon]